MRRFIGFVLMIGSWIGALYVGGWLMFVSPIIEACKAFDAGTLTGYIVGVTILKCIFAGTVGSLVAYFGTLIGAGLAASD